MKAERFDLSVHGIDEAAGKTVDIAGATYFVWKALGEGGESIVYSLVNVATNLGLFVLKIQKVQLTDEDAARYRRAIARAELRASHARLPYLRHEVHFAGNVLVRLQRLSGIVDLEECSQLMEAAEERGRADDIEGACERYAEVLSLNPLHSLAVLEWSRCCERLGKGIEAVTPLLQAIEAEPNLPDLHRRLGELFVTLGWPELGVQQVIATLSRYEEDHDSLRWVVSVAAEHDLVEIAQHFLARTREIGEAPELLADLERPLEEAASRRAALDRALSEAYQLQMAGRWEDSRAVCTAALNLSRDNLYAYANVFLCDHRLGRLDPGHRDFRNARIRSGFQRTGAGPNLALLELLCHVEARRWDAAAKIAAQLEGMFSDAMDLPSIPVFLSAKFHIEDRYNRSVTETLGALVENAPAAEREAVRRLVDRYRLRTARVTEAGPTMRPPGGPAKARDFDS